MNAAACPARFIDAHDRTWLSRIEDAGLNASAPPQQRWMDGWLVRLSPGKAQRARCINAVAAGHRPPLQMLAECRVLYAAAGLPLLVRITPFTQPPELDRLLADAGFEYHDDTRVMVLPYLRALARNTQHERRAEDPVPARPGLPEGTAVAEVTATAYAEVVGELRGSAATERGAHAARLAQSPVPYRGFVLHEAADPSAVLACAQMAGEGPLVGLYDVMTSPAARRQGYASRLCEYLLALAATGGAKSAYLQVGADNEAGRSVYRRMGFSDAYSYHYRRAPAA